MITLYYKCIFCKPECNWQNNKHIKVWKVNDQSNSPIFTYILQILLIIYGVQCQNSYAKIWCDREKESWKKECNFCHFKVQLSTFQEEEKCNVLVKHWSKKLLLYQPSSRYFVNFFNIQILIWSVLNISTRKTRLISAEERSASNHICNTSML